MSRGMNVLGVMGHGRDARATAGRMPALRLGALLSNQLRRGQKARGAALLGGLLESIGELEEGGFAPGAAEEGNPHRQRGDESRRDGNMGVARHGGGGGTAPDVVVAV